MYVCHVGQKSKSESAEGKLGMSKVKEGEARRPKWILMDGYNIFIK